MTVCEDDLNTIPSGVFLNCSCAERGVLASPRENQLSLSVPQPNLACVLACV